VKVTTEKKRGKYPSGAKGMNEKGRGEAAPPKFPDEGLAK